jgi:hypothetical protein
VLGVKRNFSFSLESRVNKRARLIYLYFSELFTTFLYINKLYNYWNFKYFLHPIIKNCYLEKGIAFRAAVG